MPRPIDSAPRERSFQPTKPSLGGFFLPLLLMALFPMFDPSTARAKGPSPPIDRVVLTVKDLDGRTKLVVALVSRQGTVARWMRVDGDLASWSMSRRGIGVFEGSTGSVMKFSPEPPATMESLNELLTDENVATLRSVPVGGVDGMRNSSARLMIRRGRRSLAFMLNRGSNPVPRAEAIRGRLFRLLTSEETSQWVYDTIPW